MNLPNEIRFTLTARAMTPDMLNNAIAHCIARSEQVRDEDPDGEGRYLDQALAYRDEMRCRRARISK